MLKDENATGICIKAAILNHHVARWNHFITNNYDNGSNQHNGHSLIQVVASGCAL
jgi:phosphotransferase system HPr-like phosphotransfer protein